MLLAAASVEMSCRQAQDKIVKKFMLGLTKLPFRMWTAPCSFMAAHSHMLYTQEGMHKTTSLSALDMGYNYTA